MDQEARYWRDKWLQVQRQLETLIQTLDLKKEKKHVRKKKI